MLTALAVCSAAWWVFQAAFIEGSVRSLARLPDLPDPDLRSRSLWPTVSIVVPAKNEGVELEAALKAKLAEGYPALEVVVVNDRSTDDTGRIANDIAASDPRVKVTHVTDLPDGWLGKVHALQKGVERSSGEWLLFSDADVHLGKGSLARIIDWADQNGVDHVPMCPSLTASGFWLTSALATFYRLLSVVPMWKAKDPASKVALGSGAFNLFRRSALEQSPGLQWLKMEVADDMGLGAMLKRAGARQQVMVGQQMVSLRFYATFGTFMRALEKQGALEPAPLMLSAVALITTLELGFFAGLFVMPWLTVAVFVFAGLVQLRNSKWSAMARWPAWLPWLGVMPLAFVLIRSTVLAVVRGGIVWRDTFYPSRVLREGHRLGRHLEKNWPR